MADAPGHLLGQIIGNRVGHTRVVRMILAISSGEHPTAAARRA